MKGGVTCLGHVFFRKNKVKSAIVDSATVKGSEDPHVYSERNVEKYSGSLWPGKEATPVVENHDVSSGLKVEEAQTVLSSQPFVFTPAPTSSISLHNSQVKEVVQVDVDVPTRLVESPLVLNLVCETEYEGEDEKEECSGARGVRDCDCDHSSSEKRSEIIGSYNSPSPSEVLDKDSARYYDELSASGTFGESMQREDSYRDLEMASGHVSDPGVYNAKNLGSACSSPALRDYQAEEKEKNEGMGFSEVRLGPLSESELSGRHLDNASVVSGQQMTVLSYESASSIAGEPRDGSEVPSGGCVALGGSPRSETACQRDADRALFKFSTSSLALEAQRRKPWWKLFLASHRNIHREVNGGVSGLLSEGAAGRISPLNGYVSDVEAGSGRTSPSLRIVCLSDVEKDCPGRASGKDGILNRDSAVDEGLTNNSSGHMLESNVSAIGCESGPNMASGGEAVSETHVTARKWDSFQVKTGLSRVEEWVNHVHPVAPALDEDQFEVTVENGPNSPTAPAASFFGEFGEESPKELWDKQGVSNGRGDGVLDADVEMAKMVVRSVNPLSTVAHFSGVGLRVLPSLGVFSSLKTLNLSANHFVRIIPGCLPKSLHTLDLSRNKIVLIEGLRELTRLRALNLSFNRISRIGNGLSNCMSLKELYLVGNKISEVEGLHRLSKLSVLDLSFNKLTTTKSLGQIAANYRTLAALNLLGNAIQSNLGDDAMRRFVTGICPQVIYLNKQVLKSHTNRDGIDNTVARAALGALKNNSKSTTSKAPKRSSGHQSTETHRRSHSGGGSKTKAAGKGGVSPVRTAQEGSYRKSYHRYSRPLDKHAATKELPRGFVPLPLSACSPLKGGLGELAVDRCDMPRVRSDGALFREDRHTNMLLKVSSEQSIAAH